MSATRFGLALALATSLTLIGCAGDRGDGGDERVTLSFVGDILLDSAPGRAISRGQDPFAPTAALLKASDLSLGNLECPVATSGAAVDKIYTFRAAPSTLPLLAQYFAAVSVANNHSGDYGREAFRETLDQLTAARLPYFGGGRDLSEAHRPLVLEKRGLKIALLGYDDYHPRSFEAAPDRPGVAWAEDEQIIWDIARARRAGANIVLPFLHWGWENEPGPSARQRELAHALIDAGADAVIGSHPHVTQGAEMYRGKPIVYSLGNFVFDLLDRPENADGWVLELVVDRNGVRRFSTRAVHIDEQGTPAPVAGSATPCGVRGARVVSYCQPR
ncbi:MAG TPA: CapA family protein [Polyangiaceae bacterium]|jgi:poly-gamma-glutamate synthesis protein (capsule biosynthesis protein)